MKSIRDIIKETVNPPKSPDEQNFVDKHEVEVQAHPKAEDDQFKAKAKKDKTRKADYDEGEDADMYEEMTPAQMKKREEIVLSMKKKMGEFKDKYGDKAKDVMYATATKMAMKEENLSEDPFEEVPMMERQLEFIGYAAEEIKEYLMSSGADPEEWFQNKLATVHSQITTLHSYIEGDKRVRASKMGMTPVGEEVELDEAFKMGSVKLKDGTTAKLSKDDAEAVNELFAELNSSNKKKMEERMMADKKGFDEILKFAREAM